MISQSLSLMAATVVVATNGKANEEQQMTNFFQSTKGFNASTREIWSNFSSDDERSTSEESQYFWSFVNALFLTSKKTHYK